MTKSEIINEIAVQTGLQKNMIADTIDTFMDVIKENLANGESIFLRGFGTFETRFRKEKVARNIAKNTTILVPAHFVAKFRAAQDMEDMIKQSKELNKQLKKAKTKKRDA